MLSILRCLITPYLTFCFVICLVVTLLPWWPASDKVLVAKYLLLFAPRWWLLLLVLGTVIFWRFLSKFQWLILFILVLFSLNYLDFQLPKLGDNENSSKKLTVITANIGGGGSKEVIQLLMLTEDPDILLLQEAMRIDIVQLVGDKHYSECISGLCIVSKYPFTNITTLDRKAFQGWGKFAALYQVKTANGLIAVANIHLETPRAILMGLRYGVIDTLLAQEIENNRELEVSLITRWRKDLKFSKGQNFIIAGDFNMPEDDSLYQQNFSDLNNAVAELALGFNYTKFTSWHGVRIDHILYSDGISIQDVAVLKSFKGDHRPVKATLLLE